MDAITQSLLSHMAALYPASAIRLTHQFLDGTTGRECGCVPAEWDGSVVTIHGKWW